MSSSVDGGGDGNSDTNEDSQHSAMLRPVERERLLSDLVDGEHSFSFADVDIATPDKQRLLDRLLDSPAVDGALRNSNSDNNNTRHHTTRRTSNFRRASASAVASPVSGGAGGGGGIARIFVQTMLSPRATHHRRTHSAPSSAEHLPKLMAVSPTTASLATSPNPVVRLRAAVAPVSTVAAAATSPAAASPSSPAAKTSPRVRQAAALSATRRRGSVNRWQVPPHQQAVASSTNQDGQKKLQAKLLAERRRERSTSGDAPHRSNDSNNATTNNKSGSSRSRSRSSRHHRDRDHRLRHRVVRVASEDGWTVEYSDSGAEFASDEFDSDSDDSRTDPGGRGFSTTQQQRHTAASAAAAAAAAKRNSWSSASPTSKHSGGSDSTASAAATTTTNIPTARTRSSSPDIVFTPRTALRTSRVVEALSHTTASGEINCRYCAAVEMFEAEESDELDVESGDVLVCRVRYILCVGDSCVVRQRIHRYEHHHHSSSILTLLCVCVRT